LQSAGGCWGNAGRMPEECRIWARKKRRDTKTYYQLRGKQVIRFTIGNKFFCLDG